MTCTRSALKMKNVVVTWLHGIQAAAPPRLDLTCLPQVWPAGVFSITHEERFEVSCVGKAIQRAEHGSEAARFCT